MVCSQFRLGHQSPLSTRCPSSTRLKRYGDGNWIIRVIPVIQVVPVSGVVKIHIVGFVPVWSPGFRPRIDDRNPIAVVLEARLSAHKDQGKAVDAEEVIPTKIEPEPGIWNPVAVIAAPLAPGLMFVVPRTGTRLNKAVAYLALMLRNAAGVYSAIGRAIRLHTAVISAAIGLLRFCLALRRSRGLLRMRLLRGLRMMRLRLLRGTCLLRLCCRFRLTALLRSLRIALVLSDGCGCAKQRKNRYTNNSGLFHSRILQVSALVVRRSILSVYGRQDIIYPFSGSALRVNNNFSNVPKNRLASRLSKSKGLVEAVRPCARIVQSGTQPRCGQLFVFTHPSASRSRSTGRPTTRCSSTIAAASSGCTWPYQTASG